MASKAHAALAAICGIAALSNPACAAEPSPAQIFNDDAVLTAARRNILEMDYTELASLRGYFGQCVDELSQNPQIQHLCDASLEEYRIEFEADRPIDELLNAAHIVVGLLRSGEAARKPTDAKLLERFIKVDLALKDAMTARFGVLRAQEPVIYPTPLPISSPTRPLREHATPQHQAAVPTWPELSVTQAV